MNITASTVTKIRIEGAPALDPIDVFLEDHAPKQGSVTIKCYGQSWTTYWGSMWEGMTVGQFFCEASESYVIDRLWPVWKQDRITDLDALHKLLRGKVCAMRRQHLLRRYEAREHYDEVPLVEDSHIHSELLGKLLGYDYWNHVPTKTSPDYEYLTRIVQAVRQALPQAVMKP